MKNTLTDSQYIKHMTKVSQTDKNIEKSTRKYYDLMNTNKTDDKVTNQFESHRIKSLLPEETKFYKKQQ